MHRDVLIKKNKAPQTKQNNDNDNNKKKAKLKKRSAEKVLSPRALQLPPVTECEWGSKMQMSESGSEIKKLCLVIRRKVFL